MGAVQSPYLTGFERSLVRARSVFACLWLGVCLEVHPALRAQDLQAQNPQQQGAQAAGVVSETVSATVEKVDINARAGGVLITVNVSAAVAPTTVSLENPDRLVFDFPGCDIRSGNRTYRVDRGPVKELRTSLFSEHPPVARLVLDLKEPVEFKVSPLGKQVVIQISFVHTQPASTESAAEKVHEAAQVDKEAPQQEVVKQEAPKQEVAKAEVAKAEVAKQEPPSEKVSLPPAQKPPAPENATQGADQQTGAYSLMEKAKAIGVGDLENLETKAEAGDPQSETMLALAYHAGVLLKRNDAEALRLLHQAAEQGSMAAEESLGIFAEMGIGMEPAPADAMNWYQKAAQKGSLDADTDIALMYAGGKGVAKDNAQALIWFRRAADGGDAAAQYNLALMYERGDGVPRDYKEAARWLTAAADQNLVPACMELAEMLLRPPDASLGVDAGKAALYYEKAGDAGNAVAQAILGTIFARGLAGKVDYDESVKWYRMAAEQGNADGELGLGVSYGLGHGVPVDYDEARQLLTAAAEQGQIEAQYDLAILCEEGKGAPPDRDLAAHYYELAAERGLAKAQYRYGVLLAQQNGSRSNRIAAYKWLMLAQDAIQESAASLSEIRKVMSGEELAEAEREVDSWRIAHKSRQH